MMADSSLDEFFAKKDKTKKSKNKAKFMTSEQIGLAAPKKQEEKRSDKGLKREKERGPGGVNPQSNTALPEHEEKQEWKEVEEEQEKDYSGLRIQTLSLGDREKDDELGKDQMPQEEGDEFRSNEGPQGPWKISSAAADSTILPGEKEDEEPEEKPEPVEAPTTQPKKYVPPHRTAGSSVNTQQSSNPYSSRRYGKSVPEMDSELHFPSLSAVSDSDRKGVSDNDKSFQSVTRGYKSKDGPSQGGGVQLDLGNKYSALRQ